MMFDPICSGFTSISCKTYYIYISELSKMIPKETISYRKPGIIFSNEARRWKTCVPVWKRCGETAPGGVRLVWEYVVCWTTKSPWWDWGW
jgi:hypothetical protein